MSRSETCEHLDRLRHEIARDLHEVGDLSGMLRVEAWHRHSDRDLPGGDALAMLGPTAVSYAHFDREVNRAEALYYDGRAAGRRPRWPEIYDTDLDPQPPLLVLGSWVDIVRKELGLPGAQWQPSIQRELTFLVNQLDWITGADLTGEPRFPEADALAYDLARLRRRLEAVLHDSPDDHSVPCIRCTGEERGRLQPIWGEAVDGEDDQWHCARCGALLTREDYRRALAAAHRLTATALCASDILLEYGVSMATLRKWAERGHVRKHARDGSGRVTYDVDDVLERRRLAAEGHDGKFKADATIRAGA
jgi:hypothetical protein